jgi:ubiquinone/menaquinone biosynthesis C-methylase UbiE
LRPPLDERHTSSVERFDPNPLTEARVMRSGDTEGLSVQDVFEEDAKRYDARQYGAGFRTFIIDRHALVRHLLDAQGLPSRAPVLDVACGPGHFLSEVLSRGLLPVGIDHSMAMLQLASKRTNGQSRLSRGDATLLPFKPGSFSLVNCSGLIEYFEDPRPVFREILRVLRPGGYAMISSTNRRSPALAFEPVVNAIRESRIAQAVVSRVAPRFDRRSLIQRRFHLTFHSPQELQAVMTETGFTGSELHFFHLQLLPHPLEHVFPRLSTFLVSRTDSLLRRRLPRQFAEGLVVVGRRSGA